MDYEAHIPPFGRARYTFERLTKLSGIVCDESNPATINTQARMINEVEVLASPETGWVLGQSPVFSVYDAASAVVGGRLYIFGGGDVSNTLNSTDHLQIYTPVAD